MMGLSNLVVAISFPFALSAKLFYLFIFAITFIPRILVLIASTLFYELLNRFNEINYDTTTLSVLDNVKLHFESTYLIGVGMDLISMIFYLPFTIMLYGYIQNNKFDFITTWEWSYTVTWIGVIVTCLYIVQFFQWRKMYIQNKILLE